MICPQCGNVLSDSSTVCPECGMSLKDKASISGAAGIRQGRTGKNARRNERAVSYSAYAAAQQEAPGLDEDAENARNRVPEPVSGKASRAAKRAGGRTARRFMVNWALVWTVLLVLVFLGAAGGFLYLKTSDAGQLILARLGYDANAEALWALGTEYLDQGYIERAILSYESAYELEPGREDIYSKLLLLGEAYLAGGYMSKAEDLYTKMYTEIDPDIVTAYRLKAGILSSQNRSLELASFLKEAYQATGDASFSRQREELVPSAPTASLAAGKYMLDQAVNEQHKLVELISDEDYDIYYLDLEKPDDSKVLPDDGVKYTGPIELNANYHIIRAVAVSSELVSDEMVIVYTVTAPTPVAPKLSLAPGEYQTRQRVWLRYTGPDADTVTMYYTIDGQNPDEKTAPIYTGDPILLPGGRIHVKAIAVNSYGIRSNVMDVLLKINIDFKRYFNASDTFDSFVLLSTTRDQFVRKYGSPVSESEISDPIAMRCIRLDYSWGHACFMSSSAGYVIYDFETNSSSFSAPRSTKCGMNSAAVTEKFRDMGQPEYRNGDRSIYWDENQDFAKLYKLENSEYSARIDYVYHTEDGGQVILSYYLTGDIVAKIGVRYSGR